MWSVSRSEISCWRTRWRRSAHRMGEDRVERRGRRFSRRKTLIESQIESQNFIGGEWVPADSGETSEIVNPANPSEVLGTTPKSGAAEVQRATEAAAAALPGWKATLPSARGAILMKVADTIESKT